MNTSSSSSSPSSRTSTPLPVLYEQWERYFPSALASLNRITRHHAKSKRIVLFLNYDGTLSPILNNPKRAAKMRSVLKNITKHFQTSIISGQSRTEVKQFIGIKELYYAGSHGMDISGPDGQQVLEIRPQDQWNKGNAIQFLLKTLRLEDCSDILPIYIGADCTDEDAFKVLRNSGCGILVSSVPKETAATYSLKNPLEVMSFLESLVIDVEGLLD